MNTVSTAAEAFGGAESLADTILDVLSRNAVVLSDPNLSALETLRRYSRQQILDMLFDSGTSLDTAMPLQLTAEQERYWLNVMHDRGAGAMIGSDGSQGDEAIALTLFVRMEALKEVCTRELAEQAAADTQRIRSLRAKYASLLNSAK